MEKQNNSFIHDTINLDETANWRIESYAIDKAGNKNVGETLTESGWHYQNYTVELNYIHFMKLHNSRRCNFVRVKWSFRYGGYGI